MGQADAPICRWSCVKAIITAWDHPLRAKTEVIIFPTARGRKKDARKDLIEINRSGSSAKDLSSQMGRENSAVE
jgi:hypothetical protein